MPWWGNILNISNNIPPRELGGMVDTQRKMYYVIFTGKNAFSGEINSYGTCYVVL